MSRQANAGLFEVRRIDPDKLNNGDIGRMARMLDRSFDALADAAHHHRPSLFRS